MFFFGEANQLHNRDDLIVFLVVPERFKMLLLFCERSNFDLANSPVWLSGFIDAFKVLKVRVHFVEKTLTRRSILAKIFTKG